MSDPNDLQAFLAEAWRHLTRGTADARAPARYPTFATVSPQGRPEARTVALRRADREQAILEVHTDIETLKVAALRINKVAAFHIWVPKSDLQIRASGMVEILTGDAVAGEWAKVPPGSRVSYGTMPVPGSPIADVYDYAKPADQNRFAVLRCQLEEIDLVHLGARHRRAAFMAQDGWQGQWVAP